MLRYQGAALVENNICENRADAPRDNALNPCAPRHFADFQSLRRRPPDLSLDPDFG